MLCASVRGSPGGHAGPRARCRDDRRSPWCERPHHLGRGGELRPSRRVARNRPHPLPRPQVVVDEVGPGARTALDQPATRGEERIAVPVGPDRLRGAVCRLDVRARVAQIAHRAEVQHRRSSRLAHPAGQLAGERQRGRGIVALRLLVAELRPRAQRALGPGGRRRHADPQSVVLADEEERHRQVLVGRVRSRVECCLRRRVVERRVAEACHHHRVRRPGTVDAELPGPVDRDRDADGPRQVRRDRGRLRDHRERMVSEHLVASAGDRLVGRGGDAEHDVRHPVVAHLARAGEVEGARAVVEQRRIGGPQRQGHGTVALVARRADRVEAPALLLQPARREIAEPAVDLRPPQRLDAVRRGTGRACRRERGESLQQV